ncbi:AAA family ATPase [Shewanella sp. 1_MG-2023]|uniref:ExeA family protein n=1 Tax=unclassified Shewanella TaxID=196818 RepID=UPI0026E481F5|nr:MULTISPECIES: AAA family ATPase [unclassified Shewanella]MDO6610578.1 AAA family ATPase [Shewanella sp. 7_MG-2023]MDO6770703.1 AAA family ATPase [Shewanella sp. 2_MG-2023]MDO6793279.1 AAA family ATPase [Shewanella sp. 1_MG-2023]
MYQQHFGLNQLPFTLTPNTQFFFGLTPHVEALQVLQTAIENGEGFIKVTGEVGTGKTLICRKLLNELPDNYQCAYVPNPYLNPDELRWALATELGISLQDNINQQQLTGLIQNRLLELNRQGLKVILVLDEAQALPNKSLETLRLFTNLETESAKLIQVVLFGQPELDNRLQDSQLRQLKQRITFSYSLRPLLWDEIQAYVDYRLSIAGYRGKALFSDKDIKLISSAARGIPRLVNVIVNKALLLCFAEGGNKVLTKHCKAAIVDTEDAEPLPTSVQNRGWLYILLIIGASLVMLWVTNTDWLSTLRESI